MAMARPRTGPRNFLVIYLCDMVKHVLYHEVPDEEIRAPSSGALVGQSCFIGNSSGLAVQICDLCF
jgi:hypothetical protein